HRCSGLSLISEDSVATSRSKDCWHIAGPAPAPVLGPRRSQQTTSWRQRRRRTEKSLNSSFPPYVYLSKRLTVLPASRFYRFVHIVTYSSGKVVGKVKAPDVIIPIGCPAPSQTSGRQISPSAETACRYSRRPWRTGGDC